MFGALVACGGKVGSQPAVVEVPDDGVSDGDTSVPDDVPPPPLDSSPPPFDSRPPPLDSKPPPPDTAVGCASALPADYACPAVKIPTGATSCSETTIQAFSVACFGGGTSADCSAWIKSNPDCYKCVGKFLSPTGYIEFGYCMQSVAPSSPCGKLEHCQIDCNETVCVDCDHTAGSGTSGTTSEFLDCVRDADHAGSATKPKGRCYDLAVSGVKTNNCTSDAATGGCVDVVQFFRGACRDGADWSKMTSSTAK